jgi:hypothetical protein
MPIQGVSLLCDISPGQVRPLVPEADRRAVFVAVHSLAHSGIRATRPLLTSRFVWKGVASDVNRWCRECTACNRGKTTRQHKSTAIPIAIPALRFSHGHMDLVGPLPQSAAGHSYLFTMIDRSTCWLEASLVKNIEASTCADAFIANRGSRLQKAECPPFGHNGLPPSKQRYDRAGP